MRVMHVVRQFAPSVGGLEDVALHLARHQRERHGLDARVVTLDRVFGRPGERLAARAEVAGVPVSRLPWWGSPRYPIAPGVLRAVMGADLVQVHAVDFFADFLALTRPMHRKPLVLVTQGGIFHTARQAALKRAWFGTVTRATLRAFDAVVAGSENDAGLFAPLRPRRMVTIENGAELGKLRGAEGVARLPGRILCLGRFAPHKRIGALFPLLARLRAGGGDWTLVVAGVEAGDTVVGLRERAGAAGVEGAVRFVVGAADAALAREAAAASWFACASAFEGFGVAAVEAAAAGLVPILSGIPTFRRLAEGLPEAVLFDPEAPEAGAAAVLACLARCSGRWDAVRAGLAGAAERHGWPDAVGRYVRLYEEILRERGRPVLPLAEAA